MFGISQESQHNSPVLTSEQVAERIRAFHEQLEIEDDAEEDGVSHCVWCEVEEVEEEALWCAKCQAVQGDALFARYGLRGLQVVEGEVQ